MAPVSCQGLTGKVFSAGTISIVGDYVTGGMILPNNILDLFSGTSNEGLDNVLFGEKDGYACEYLPASSKVKVKNLILNATGASAVPSATTNLTLQVGVSDIKGSINTDSENADAAAVPVNGALVNAAAAVAAAAWTPGAYTNPDIGRNVCIVINNPTGGPLNLYEGAMAFTITGTYKGAAQTDVITITSTAGNKAVATTKCRYKYGVKPFDTITAASVDNICDNALTISVGIGSKIGISNALPTPAAADVYKLSKTGADLAVGTLVDTTEFTINFGVLADGDDVAFWYKGPTLPTATHTHGIGTFTTGGEVTAATALNITDIPFLAYGI
jgi:hypothetical protein